MDAIPERSLWCAVVLQAVSDAHRPHTWAGADPAALRDEARRWIASPAFDAVAELAGVDPVAVRERVL